MEGSKTFTYKRSANIAITKKNVFPPPVTTFTIPLFLDHHKGNAFSCQSLNFKQNLPS